MTSHCKYCDKPYKTKQGLSNHVVNKHWQSKATEQESEEK